MKILFLHSGLTLTGSVTYARALEQAWRGVHQVYWANDGFTLPGQQGLVVNLRYPLIPYSFWQIGQVARYVHDNQIQIMHAHSRRASLVAAGAAQLTRIPYVVTAHLRTQARFANRVLPCWGDRTLAICETVGTHLQQENHVPPERIHLIRNGIDLNLFRTDAVTPTTTSDKSVRWITILGQLSGKRWHPARLLLSLIPDIARDFPDVRFRFVGWVDPVHQTELDECVRRINTGDRQPRVVLTGHITDPRPLLAESTLVVAAGRSLMETMAMEVPVIAMGEQSSYGLLTPDNYGAAQKTNFGDFPQPGKEGFDTTRIVEGIRSILKGTLNVSELKHWGREQMLSDYDLTKIAKQVEDVYALLR